MIFSETREIKDQSHNLYSREMLIKFVFSGGDSTFRIRHLWLRLFLECFNLCAQARRGRKSTTDSLPLHVGWLAFIVKTFWCLEFDLAGLQAEQLDVSLPDFCALQLVCGWWCFFFGKVWFFMTIISVWSQNDDSWGHIDNDSTI